ncbi:Mitochondrial inner membrane protease ATP23 [Tetrabaena socialis]|uniref:Mitochondrial inner membrane protease ATP23 n=1 Tax=Tetrabaena socialis TaxID=47790 RepID=A0A2J8A9N8_9CHLO|nr:Mitochondrial inner membrane protease ATP23 [Tetrabaena socialis]|eukprot:PNH09236.1 Mitochondrial inner membrane protease ATP23 [Tetrabaena socialis]
MSVAQPGPLETLTSTDVADAVDRGLSSSRPVRTLMQAMAEVGCPVGRSFFHVLRCDAAVSGGFVPDHGIRAANLSGDCSLWQELSRGNLPRLPTAWAAQQRACVARRAALSVALNPACGGAAGAAGVVAEMMGGCLADVAPFEADEGVARP